MVRNEMIYRKQMKQKKSKAKEKQNIFHFELNGFFKTISTIKPNCSKRWHAFSFKIMSSFSLVRNRLGSENAH